jgi:hypothetical protein
MVLQYKDDGFGSAFIAGATGLAYGQVICIILFAFVYPGSIGPIGYALFVEISNSRLRSRTIGLGIGTGYL